MGAATGVSVPAAALAGSTEGSACTALGEAQTRRGYTAVFFVLCLTLLSRGVLEVLVGKAAAYAVQLVAMALLAVFLFAVGDPKWRAEARGRLLALYVFSLSMVVSCVLSLWLSDIDYFAAYVMVMLAFGCWLAMSSSARFLGVRQIAVGPVVAALTYVLVGVAILQQYVGLDQFPGSDRASLGGTVRPASLTGSYLHYPLAVAILLIILAGLYVRQRRRYLLVGATVATCAVLMSFSRSGMMIVALTAAIGLLMLHTLSARLKLVYLGVVIAVGVLTLAPSSPYVARAMSAIDPASAGNVTRIQRWGEALGMWLDSPLLFGRYTGAVTNVTENLLGIESLVVESGLLQQLVNFGLVGAVAFYGLMIACVRAVPRADTWVRAGLIACVIESFIYQSIEVLPFMALFGLVPVIFGAVDDGAARPDRSR